MFWIRTSSFNVSNVCVGDDDDGYDHRNISTSTASHFITFGSLKFEISRWQESKQRRNRRRKKMINCTVHNLPSADWATAIHSTITIKKLNE